jgi:hypothetical protein
MLFYSLFRIEMGRVEISNQTIFLSVDMAQATKHFCDLQKGKKKAGTDIHYHCERTINCLETRNKSKIEFSFDKITILIFILVCCNWIFLNPALDEQYRIRWTLKHKFKTTQL